MTKVPRGPSGRFIGETGASPRRRPGYQPPKDQESPQKLGDSDNLRGANDGTVSIKSWLRNGDATTMPHFDHTGKKGGK